VFDEVTKTEGGKRVARRSAFLAGSTVVQILFVAFLIVAGERIRAAVKSEPVVDVKFVRTAPPPPPPPPPPPAKKKPPSDRPKVEVKKVAPTAMIQPKTVEDQIKPPDPNEPEDDYGDGSEDGVEGGIVGGVVGGQVSSGRGYEDAPVYMGAGFKAPAMADKNCFRDSFRLPPALAGFVSSVTVKFAVYPNGAVGAFSVMGQLPDQRIGDAIRNALSNCTWIPGADAQGKPTAIYVIMPVKLSN
jgi:periplasmic protein TonB